MRDASMDVGGCCGIGRIPFATVLDPLVSSLLFCTFDNVGPDDVGPIGVCGSNVDGPGIKYIW